MIDYFMNVRAHKLSQSYYQDVIPYQAKIQKITVESYKPFREHSWLFFLLYSEKWGRIKLCWHQNCWISPLQPSFGILEYNKHSLTNVLKFKFIGSLSVTFGESNQKLCSTTPSDDGSDDKSSVPEDQTLEVLDQNDRLIELILDISNELNINILCHKILRNVGLLTQADRCSIFLAR